METSYDRRFHFVHVLPALTATSRGLKIYFVCNVDHVAGSWFVVSIWLVSRCRYPLQNYIFTFYKTASNYWIATSNQNQETGTIMRAVIQRVTRASVTIEGKVQGQIDNGVLVLIGIEDADTQDDIEWLSNKIVNLRIFNDENAVMNTSVKDVKGDILLISQFTLHGSTKKGNRPSYIRASKPEVAIPIYEKMIRQLSTDLGKKIQTGVFGADMKVELVNDGPVTIVIDTKSKE
jgi:D-tyrosyl-tRNA(Tyr) deacylase